MKMLGKTRKLGGSIIVTIPKRFAEKEGITPDQIVEIDVKKVPESGFGLFKDLPSFSRESEMRGQLDDIRD